MDLDLDHDTDPDILEQEFFDAPESCGAKGKIWGM